MKKGDKEVVTAALGVLKNSVFFRNIYLLERKTKHIDKYILNKRLEVHSVDEGSRNNIFCFSVTCYHDDEEGIQHHFHISSGYSFS